MHRLCGWTLASRLFMKGLVPNERDEEELLDHLLADLKSADHIVSRAAQKALLRYMDLSEAHEARGEKLLSTL